MPVDFDNEALLIPETAADAADGRKTIVLVWLDAAHTPEDDVHGQGLEILKAQCPEDKTAFVVIIDAAEFSLTFARYPERVREREKPGRPSAKRIRCAPIRSQGPIPLPASFRSFAPRPPAGR